MTNIQQPLEFEGEEVRTIVIQLTGKSEQIDKVTKHHKGDAINMLVSGTVSKISFGDVNEELGRIETVKISAAHPLTEHEGAEFLARVRERDQKLIDQLLGRTPLWPDGVDPETGEVPPYGED